MRKLLLISSVLLCSQLSFAQDSSPKTATVKSKESKNSVVKTDSVVEPAKENADKTAKDSEKRGTAAYECEAEVQKIAAALGPNPSVSRSSDTRDEYVYYAMYRARSGPSVSYWIQATKRSCSIQSIKRDDGE